ncbi:hypothetical protein D869_gp118 [Caulobacter phage CcrRogue]|uniref:Uncharacterized protein n=1 Tax=Caulobacter phage CcrRogue TaxID=2927986 RepID=K4JP56_9CAUD|nr:hypothetical protein D869_gp118 [Caulobacter phage CcrRogue]AFU86796.1 hypothetical protein CcrRogue_gp314 [Caulobacter phage CcrRogue]
MPKTCVKMGDLGLGWYASSYSDDSMTVRNPEKGLRIDLESESVERLRQFFAQAKAEAAGRAA